MLCLRPTCRSWSPRRTGCARCRAPDGWSPPAVAGASCRRRMHGRAGAPPHRRRGCGRLRSIDLLLDGGLRSQELTELAGPSASGKTQLCLHIAVHHVATDPAARVLLIPDHDGRDAAARMERMCERVAAGSGAAGAEALLSRIQCAPVHDAFELQAALGAVRESMCTASAHRLLVIVDPLGAILSTLFCGEAQSVHGYAFIMAIASRLKTLAVEGNVPVLVTLRHAAPHRRPRPACRVDTARNRGGTGAIRSPITPCRTALRRRWASPGRTQPARNCACTRPHTVPRPDAQ